MTSSENANVALWSKYNAKFTDANARRQWQQEDVDWGVFNTPESEVNVIGDVDGLDVVELGCGTAYFGAWLAKRGARVTGVDPTPAQLDTARRLREELATAIELVEAYGEDVPLPDASFDLAISEYGASLWADPYKWIPEAARLLRPGGRLVFLRNSTLSMVCAPDTGQIEERLMRAQRGMYRLDWTENEGGIEFHLPHGELIDLLRANGFEIERLVELYAGDDAKTNETYDYVTAGWARKWPAEEIWAARKRA